MTTQPQSDKQSFPEGNIAPDSGLLGALSGLEQQLQIIRDAYEKHEAWKHQVAQTEAALAQREHALKVLETKFAHDTQEFEHRRAAIDSDLETLADSEQQLSDRETHLAQLGKSLERQRVELHSLKSELEHSRTDLEARTARLSEENRSLRKAREAAAEEIGTLQSHIAALEGQVAELQTRGESLSGQLLSQAENDASLVERCDQQERSIGELRASLNQANDTIAQREQASSKAHAQLDSVSNELRVAQQRIAAMKEELSKLRLELETSRRDGPAVEQHLKSLHEQIAVAEERAGNSAVELDRVSEENTRLRDHAEQLEQDYDKVRRQLEHRSTSNQQSEAVALRRERLDRVRSALHRKQSKLNQATELLRDRYDQAEKIIHQRDAVQRSKRDVAQLHERLAKRAARSKSFSFVFFFVASLGVLAGISWAVASKFVPQKYVATSLLAAESRGRTLTESDLANWQRYHNSLALSPEFIEFAATRMARKGYSTLGKPGELRVYLDSSLDIRSPLDGTIEFELVGEGAARTADILSTFVSAFQTRANQARELRTDGAATIVKTQPAAAEDPIHDTRPLIAATIFGGTSVLTTLIGFLLWKKLVKSALKAETTLHTELKQIERGLPEWERSIPNAA